MAPLLLGNAADDWDIDWVMVVAGTVGVVCAVAYGVLASKAR